MKITLEIELPEGEKLSFARLCRAAMGARGLTTAQVAEACAVSPSTVNRWTTLTGVMGMPERFRVPKLSLCLGIKVGDIHSALDVSAALRRGEPLVDASKEAGNDGADAVG